MIGIRRVFARVEKKSRAQRKQKSEIWQASTSKLFYAVNAVTKKSFGTDVKKRT